MKLYAILFCWLFFVNLIFSGISLAVNISEVHPTEEYIEIFSDEYADFTGWKYSEMTSTGKENLYAFPFSSISAGGYLLISLSNKINDTGDTVSIYAANGEKVDSIIIPAKKTGMSYSLLEGSWIWTISSPSLPNVSPFTPTPPPTPLSSSTPTPTPTPTPYPALIITEMFPDPEGTDGLENEYFELFNPTENSFDIAGWKVVDTSGDAYIFASQRIESQSVLAVYRSQSGITLNNTGETLTLFDPNGQSVSVFQYSGTAKSGESFGVFADQTCWMRPSANTQNTACLSTSIPPSVATTFENNMIPFPVLKSPTNPVILQIISVSPNASPDSIEVKCVSCNTDIAGIRLGIDGVAYTIPENIFAKTGDILRFVFQKDTTEPPRQLGGGWMFFVPISGLSLSDESIYLVDSNSQILEGMCYANQNNYLESKEKKDIAVMILQNQWKGSVAEYDCVNIAAFPKNSKIVRIVTDDTNSLQDFQIVISGDSSSAVEGLLFSDFLVSTEVFEIRLKNTSSEIIPLKNIGLYNAGKELKIFPNDWLLPEQEYIVRLPMKNKSLSLDQMFLELRSSDMTLLDTICFNWIENELSNVQREHFKAALQVKKWGIDFHTPSCFSQYSNTPILLHRLDFQKFGVRAYSSEHSSITSFFTTPTPAPKVSKKTTTKKEAKKKALKVAPKNELHAVSIAKVLPNPLGADSKNEILFLINNSARSGFLRGWSLRIERKGKVTTKKLPYIFFLPHQSIPLNQPFLFAFPNTDATISLINEYEGVVSSISWKKARNDEWFGPLAPRFVEKSKQKKAKKKKSTTKKATFTLIPKPPNDVIISGVISLVDQEMILMWAEDGNFYAMDFPEYLPRAQEVFVAGKPVIIHLYKGKIKDIRPANVALQNSFVSTPASFFVLILFFLGISSVGGGMWWIGKRKTRMNIE